MKTTLYLMILPFVGVLAYIPSGKEGLLTSIILRGWLNHLKNKGGDVSYLDLSDGLPLDTRANSDSEEEQLFPLDYDNLGDVNMYPSIRDQEYLQHSSLYGNQYISGGAGELKMPKQEIKTDSSLPAYCNPPNPCPVDYTEEQGCMEDFENSATFSRNYQALQDCMCDTEHMFDCPSPGNPLVDDQMDFSRLLQQSLKNVKTNPFLTGEKLPVAAKKGNNMF